MRVWQKVSVSLSFLLLTSTVSLAQDAHFSQQYASKQRLNPAFTGLTAEASATLAYRNQWPTLTGAFISNYFGGDFQFGETNNAAGVSMMLDKAGNSGFNQFEVSGMYSYRTRISKKFAVSAGLQATYGSRSIKFNELTFGDQLSDDGLKEEPSAEINSFDPVHYLSFGSGAILYTNQFWLGISANHLNQPDLGFTGTSELPLKTVVNVGYKFYAETHTSQNKFYELSFTPTVTYTKQGPFSKTDLGLYTLYTPVTVGILYRGLPIGGTFEQAIVFIVGIQLNQFKAAYSYDVGLSGLSASSGGAHEITLAFEKVDYTKIFKKRARNKNYLQIACPAF